MSGLNDPIITLKGVGEKRQVALNKLGISTINDLLMYFPRRYDDFTLVNLAAAMDGQKVTVKGIVLNSPTVSFYGRKKSRLTLQLKINEEVYRVTFFNQPWLAKQIPEGQEIVVFGTLSKSTGQITGIKLINKQSGTSFDSIYPTTKDVKQNTIKNLEIQAFSEYEQYLVDIIPKTLSTKYRLMSLHDMVKNMHFPDNQRKAQLAARSAKFTELFLFTMQIQELKSAERQINSLASLSYDKTVIEKFVSELDFKLTRAQSKVAKEILQDLNAPFEMNRLLQGDVGSGKTVIAAIAILATITAHKQAAIMAPTEILAEQHANSFAKMFTKFAVNIALLTSDTPVKARRSLLKGLADGAVDLVVGTHALFQTDVVYHDLGLAVIDEQHRFGVNQRRALRIKGQNTNVLSMTATPIPRTLAITMYGNTDVSIIDELPAGRKPIKTTCLSSNQADKAISFVNQQLKAGHQVYVITPLIEESESVDMKNAVAIFERFKGIFEPTFKVGLVHGRMTNEEKNDAMLEFERNEFQVLVSTTVIEVGVDVKNANTIMIYDADHFGLAQLHQLRGRVGRGSDQAYCILLADPKNEVGKKRMAAITNSTDGFYLSQKDLELRGQGDVTGSKQSGVPDFQVADPVGDLNILTVANDEAATIVHQSDWQNKPENVQLARYLKTHEITTVD